MLTIEEANKLIKSGKTVKEYKNDYDNLINHCKNRGIDKSKIGFYTDLHHIVPRSMGGSDEEDNLVCLSILEHVVGHILLWYSYPSHSGIAIAALMMTSVINRRNVPKDINKELENILQSLDLEVLINIKQSALENKYNPIVCWELDYLDNPKIIKTYNYPTEVKYLESGEGRPTWRVHAQLLDDFKLHLGYYWNTFSTFEEKYPGLIDKYLENPTPRDQKIPVKDSFGNKSQHSDLIICVDEDFNILKIYYPYKNLVKDGFGITQTKVAAKKNGGVSLGYNWAFLSWMKENHRDKIEDFMKKSTNGIDIGIPIVPKAGKTSPKSVLIYDPKTYQVLRVYETAYSSKIDGFDGFRLAKKAEERDKGGDNNYNGHYVSYVKSWEYPEKLKEYYNNPPEIEIWNDVSDTITILKCDFNKDIISVFENRLDLDVGGIWDNTLSEKIDREQYHRGYLYYHPAYYKEHYPEKWEIYKEKGCTGLEEFNSKNVVTVDSDFNIIELFKDDYQDRRKLTDEESYILGIRRKTGILVWRLEKFVEKYPGKWLDYLKHKQENLTKLNNNNETV